ncbi:hypothetical protein, partial [Komagataeibacter xylinus]|uniref:hypothetical protein n=1 Tax=Komagataeibacter xylinus TaxID=28448 RepID=UPI002230FE7C
KFYYFYIAIELRHVHHELYVTLLTYHINWYKIDRFNEKLLIYYSKLLYRNIYPINAQPPLFQLHAGLNRLWVMAATPCNGVTAWGMRRLPIHID